MKMLLTLGIILILLLSTAIFLLMLPVTIIAATAGMAWTAIKT